MAIETVQSAFLQGWTFAAPGASIALELDNGTRFVSTLLANHRGCYLYLYNQNTWKYDKPFWLWDGATRLRPLDGLEQDVANALLQGKKEHATEIVTTIWRNEIAMRMQAAKLVEVPHQHWLLETFPLADMWLALTHRFAEEEQSHWPLKHEFACPQFFPIPLPATGRFVLRATRFEHLIGHMDIEIDAGNTGDDYSSFYRECADIPDTLAGIHPATWSDNHPVMRMLELAFLARYIDRVRFLNYDDDDGLNDAFAPLTLAELQDQTWDAPEWLLVFASLLAGDVRNTMPANDVRALLKGMCDLEGIVEMPQRRANSRMGCGCS